MVTSEFKKLLSSFEECAREAGGAVLFSVVRGKVRLSLHIPFFSQRLSSCISPYVLRCSKCALILFLP